MKSLPGSFKHNQQWESNPKPLDLVSVTLFTWPCVPRRNSTDKFRYIVITEMKVKVKVSV